MNKKLRIMLLSVVLLASMVGIGIHILHRDALAQTTYIIQLLPQQAPIGGVTVTFIFSSQESYERVTDDWGKATLTREGGWHSWQGEVPDWLGGWWVYIGENPQTAVEPITFLEFTYQQEQGG